MSLSRLTPSVCRIRAAGLAAPGNRSRAILSSAPPRIGLINESSKRHVHQAPDYRYWEEGFRHLSYRKAFQKNVVEMQEFPEFMDRYFRTAAVMSGKNMLPLVTAQNALFRVPSIFLRTFSSSTTDKAFFRYLRPPSSRFNISRDVLARRIEDYTKKNGISEWRPGEWNVGMPARLDHDPTLRPFLVSASYSMMDFGSMESAFYFLFSNSSNTDPEKMKKVANEAIASSLKIRGRSDKIPTVLKSVENLYAKYMDLRLGTLYVVGVPVEKVDSFAYDSRCYGVPTGESVSKVGKNLAKAKRAFTDIEGGLQARLLMCRETMTPDSGIEVIDVNSETEVEAFCRGRTLSSSRDVFQHVGIFKARTTAVEVAYRAKLQQLDDEVRHLALALKS